MNREEKLQKFRANKAGKEFLVITDGQPFIDALDGKIKSLKDVLGDGLELNNLDELITQLESVGTIKPSINELNKSIGELKEHFPDSFKIKGLESIVQAVKSINPEVKVDWLNQKQINLLTTKLDEVIIATKQAVITPAQNPGDYLPMRRVMLVGKTLMWDDSFYTGGGGGSNTPLKNGSVPVVNPDGSNIGGGSGGGAATIADGADVAEGTTSDVAWVSGSGTVIAILKGIFGKFATLATSAKQDTGNTSLASIDGKITAVNTGAVTVSSSALPAGAATSVNQGTGNTSLGNIDTNAGATADAIVAAGATGSMAAKLRRATQGLEDLKTLIVLAAGTNTIGGVTLVPSATATGLLTLKTDALVATAVAVKASAGKVYGYHIYNSNATDMFVHFYDIAQGSTTVGSSARSRTLAVPGGGVIDTALVVPLTFATAITIAATTTITGSSAPGTGLLIDVDYL